MTPALSAGIMSDRDEDAPSSGPSEWFADPHQKFTVKFRRTNRGL